MFTRVLYFCYEDVSNSFPPGHRYEESPSVERRSVCLSVRGTNTAIIIAPRIVVTMLAAITPTPTRIGGVRATISDAKAATSPTYDQDMRCAWRSIHAAAGRRKYAGT